MIETGLPKLDAFLEGGIHNSTITDIYGPSGTGKSLFALQIIKNSILSFGNVLLIDTTGSFRPERLVDLLRFENQEISLLDRIFVGRATNVKEQIKFLEKITKEFSLVVIDNISELFSFEYRQKEDVFEKNSRFFTYMKELSLRAIENNIPIVFTNTVRNIEGQELENLQKQVRLFTHLRLQLVKNNSYFFCNAFLMDKQIQIKYNLSTTGLEELP